MAHSTIPVLKLYRSYVRDQSQPDLAILFDASGGKFVWEEDAKAGASDSVWPYRRLELFANSANDPTNPTFVICTLPGSFGELRSNDKSSVYFKCHMILLNGEIQPHESDHTTIGLDMGLHIDSYKGRWAIFITTGALGATAWVSQGPGQRILLSEVNADWFDRNEPYEDLFDNDGQPGPLLQKAFIEKPGAWPYPPDDELSKALLQGFPENSSLRVELLPASKEKGGPEFATLGFVFRPGNREKQKGFVYFQLPVNPAPSSDPSIAPNPGDDIPRRFFLPLPASRKDQPPIPHSPLPEPFHSSYRLVQRPSDDWLNGDRGEPGPEWLVSLESSDLESFWNDSVESYKRALQTARSVNRISFMPRIKLGDRADGGAASDDPDLEFESKFNLSAKFLVRLDPGVPDTPSLSLNNLDIDAFRVEPLGTWNATIEFQLNNTTPALHPPDPLRYDVTISPLSAAGDFAFAFGAHLNDDGQHTSTSAPELQTVRIGSLDLECGGKLAVSQNDFDFKFSMLDLSPELQRVPRLTGNIKLPVVAVTPGGEDGISASEYVPDNYLQAASDSEVCMERRFTGSSPVIIPIEPSRPDAAYLLEINESNPDTFSQTVSMTLSINSSQVSGTTAVTRSRVVVLDSDPFLVAAVDYQPLIGSTYSNVVALWNTGNIDGAAWQLQSEAQPFTLTLPPQGIGEEMPKAKELDGKDADPIVPLDFRFSPAAPQVLQPSYTPQNFADAPWNLRRILGFPGQRDAGAGVSQLSFELLYGLSCSVSTPLLRLAEVFSLIGRIPGRIPIPQFNVLKLQAPDQKRIAAKYETKRWDWSLYAELYSKRVALLEPRASGDNYGGTTGAAGAAATPEVFSITQGVSCTFRGKADLYYSVDPADLAQVGDDSFKVHDKGLHGGVSWPFESPRIFHATVRNPNSSSAVLNGLAFSPLGGTGTVKAGFDKDLSTITSVTEIGRTSKVSVARLGRIGVFHNLARYVIEYERDTSVSSQFNGQQTPFANRPVLRKVREFVEILEPVASLSNGNQVYPGSGCVRSIEFKQRIIPVSSAWSSNVGVTGWKIPLWYEPWSKTDPHGVRKYVYVRPNVVFNFGGADGADVECGILSADKLFFYTETDTNADSDPHNWAVVSGVDFLPVPVPQPNPAFQTNKVHEIPAFDPATPFGLGSFTHQIDAGHGRVNVVQGRGNQPIGTKLGNVTLQRAPAAKSAVQNQLQALHDLVRSDLFNAVRQDPSKVFDFAQAVCDQAGAFEKQIVDQATKLINAAVDKETALLQSWLASAIAEISTLGDELRGQLLLLVGNASVPIDKASDWLKREVPSEIASASRRMSAITTAANGLAQFASFVLDQVNHLSQELETLRKAFMQSLAQASFQVTHAAGDIQQQVDALYALLADPIDRTNALLAQVRTQVQLRAEPWMPGASYITAFWESKLAPQVAAVQKILTQADVVLAYANSAADDQIDDAAQAAIQLITDAQTAVDKLVFPDPSDQTQKDFFNALTGYAKLAQALPGYIEGLPELAASYVGPWVDQATKGLQQVAKDNIDNIVDQLVGQIQGQLLSFQQDPLAQIQKDILGGAPTVATWLSTQAGKFSQEVCKAAQSLQSAVIHQLEVARRALEDALGRFAESVAQALPPVDIHLPSGVTLPVLLNRAFGEVPAIPNLGFSLPNAAYFYLPDLPHVSLTPLLTKVKDLLPNLSPLSTLVPSFALQDRALPIPNLPGFDLNNIFPDFAGLKLTNLFPALKMPAGASDAVKITHGIDQSARVAWIQADIDLKTDTASLFSVGPMALQIVSPRFTSTVRAQAGANGQVSKQASGAITGDWQLMIGGSPMITLRATGLTFDNDGKIHVNVSPDRVELSAALSFIQQIIAKYTSPDSGFGIYPSITGVETRLSLPIPNTSLGTTGITNLTFNFLFGLSWKTGFEIYAGFGLASPNSPFNLSVFILGGGGHLVATARYSPGHSLTCQVDMALDASASLSIALGPISGSVHINLGMRFIFNSGQGDLSLGIFLIIGGEVSILSIVSANILLRLDATYANGAFTCTGLFSISIKICWCFTLSVSEEVSCTLGSGGGLGWLENPVRLPWASSTELPFLPAGAVSPIPNKSVTDYETLADLYLQLVS